MTEGGAEGKVNVQKVGGQQMHYNPKVMGGEHPKSTGIIFPKLSQGRELSLGQVS